jgi:transposase
MEHRPRRYPSDTGDEQWAVIEPLLPQVSAGCHPEKHPRRAIVDAILYVVRAGCAWRRLPAGFPPWQTVYWYFNRREQDKVTEKILPAIREQLRLQEGRNPRPSAGLIDAQSVEGSDTVGRDSRGYDAGKKVNGRKRFIVTDTRQSGGSNGAVGTSAVRCLQVTPLRRGTRGAAPCRPDAVGGVARSPGCRTSDSLPAVAASAGGRLVERAAVEVGSGVLGRPSAGT